MTTTLPTATRQPTRVWRRTFGRTGCSPGATLEVSIVPFPNAVDQNNSHLENQALNHIQSLLRKIVRHATQAKADATPHGPVDFSYAAQIAPLERTRNPKDPKSGTEIVLLSASLSTEQANEAK